MNPADSRPIDHNEARRALEEIENTMAMMRRSAALHGTGIILMVWGLVWMICFGLNQFYPLHANWIWGIGNPTGIAVTLLIGFGVRGRRPVESRAERKTSLRLVWFWLALFAFMFASIAVMSATQPLDGRQIAAFVVLGIMFAYVVMGVLLDTGFLIGLGLAVTVLTLVGFFGKPGYFYLWMAVTGGGALFFSGLHIHRRWR
jgi:hypothetical protein